MELEPWIERSLGKAFAERLRWILRAVGVSDLRGFVVDSPAFRGERIASRLGSLLISFRFMTIKANLQNANQRWRLVEFQASTRPPLLQIGV